MKGMKRNNKDLGKISAAFFLALIPTAIVILLCVFLNNCYPYVPNMKAVYPYIIPIIFVVVFLYCFWRLSRLEDSDCDEMEEERDADDKSIKFEYSIGPEITRQSENKKSETYADSIHSQCENVEPETFNEISTFSTDNYLTSGQYSEITDDSNPVEEESRPTQSIDEIILTRELYSRPRPELFSMSELDFDLEETNSLIEKTTRFLLSLNIEVRSPKAIVGPRTTIIEVLLEDGISVSYLTSLKDDLSLYTSTIVKDIHPLFDRGSIGIEIQNKKVKKLFMGDVLSDVVILNRKYKLLCAIGKTRLNETLQFDLADMPHLLIAGSTGQGKTNCLHAIIISLMTFSNPADLQFILFDSKGLEFSVYERIYKQYLVHIPSVCPVISSVSDATTALDALLYEMESRYELLHKAHINDLDYYNKCVIDGSLQISHGYKYMPYIVVVIDDLEVFTYYAESSVYGIDGRYNEKNIKQNIAILTKRGAKVGIHFVISTKLPVAEVLSNDIKANIPARIALNLPDITDSRVILDGPGAEKLNNDGDMIFKHFHSIRAQCAFVESSDLNSLTEYISNQPSTPYTI